MQFVFAIGGTAFCWTLVLGALYSMHAVPRIVSVPLYYIVNVILFLLLTVALRRAGVAYAAWVFAVVVTGTLLAFGLFYWVFVHPMAAGRYLTVIDWIIPAMLVFGSVYITARLVR